MLKLQMIVGSTREGRSAEGVLRWALPLARANKDFEVEVLDLRDWPLPMFQETFATVGDFANPTYSDPLVKRWNLKIKEADAFLIITPEYNHSFPAVLKNAIDSVFISFGFRHKPAAFIGYSVGLAAGVRAVEQLNQVMLEQEAVPLKTQVLVPFVAEAFRPDGTAVQPVLDASLRIQLEDLAWLAKPLQAARAAGQLRPPTARLRAAVAPK
jgi:NAD(P)H-dependent FMN reductase